MSERPSTYTVQSGDTLSGIAATFYGDENLYQWIADANGIADANMIDVGQEITLPLTDEEAAEAAADSEAAHQAEAAAAVQAAADAQAAAAVQAEADAAATKAEIDKRVTDEVDAEKYRMKAAAEEADLQKRIDEAGAEKYRMEQAAKDADTERRIQEAEAEKNAGR